MNQFSDPSTLPRDPASLALLPKPVKYRLAMQLGVLNAADSEGQKTFLLATPAEQGAVLAAALQNAPAAPQVSMMSPAQPPQPPQMMPQQMPPQMPPQPMMAPQMMARMPPQPMMAQPMMARMPPQPAPMGMPAPMAPAVQRTPVTASDPGNIGGAGNGHQGPPQMVAFQPPQAAQAPSDPGVVLKILSSLHATTAKLDKALEETPDTVAELYDIVLGQAKMLQVQSLLLLMLVEGQMNISREALVALILSELDDGGVQAVMEKLAEDSEEEEGK